MQRTSGAPTVWPEAALRGCCSYLSSANADRAPRMREALGRGTPPSPAAWHEADNSNGPPHGGGASLVELQQDACCNAEMVKVGDLRASDTPKATVASPGGAFAVPSTTAAGCGRSLK